MSSYSVFDILGPVMIGPSSSHTAGAAALGRLARGIVNGAFTAVDFVLMGSFARTYKGHGTDRALLAGVLGYGSDDERLRDAFRYADEAGLRYRFIEEDENESRYENTVRFVFTLTDGSTYDVTGSSLGGGEVIITDMGGFALEFGGRYPTLIIEHIDKKGVLGQVSSALALFDLNIGTLRLSRSARGREASMVLELDSAPPDALVERLEKMDNIRRVKVVLV